MDPAANVGKAMVTWSRGWVWREVMCVKRKRKGHEASLLLAEMGNSFIFNVNKT